MFLNADIKLWSHWMDAQADLSHHWVHRSFCWFCCAVVHLGHFLLKWRKCKYLQKTWQCKPLAWCASLEGWFCTFHTWKWYFLFMGKWETKCISHSGTWQSRVVMDFFFLIFSVLFLLIQFKLFLRIDSVMNLNFWTGRSWQTVKTQKQQSDQSLHCLPRSLDTLLYDKTTLFKR